MSLMDLAEQANWATLALVKTVLMLPYQQNMSMSDF